MKKKFLIISLLSLTLGGLVSCNSKPTNTSSGDTEILDSVPTDFDHYYSNKISFADLGVSLGKNRFMAGKVAKLKVKSVTDGDTAVFYLDNEKDSYTNVLKNEYDYLTVRFLAIDTPESTSSIAPWGKKASKYVKEKLKNAAGVIVDATSIDTSKCETTIQSYTSGIRLDSNGSRWLGLIWYCPEGMDADNLSNYRSLQLDVIEEGYSSYTGSLGGDQIIYTADSQTEPKLYSRYKDTYGSLTLSELFLEADIRTRTLGKRKTGNEIDPNYDYSSTPTEASIRDAYDNWDNWEENAKFLQLTGVITRFVGNNFYFEDANGYPLYVYMGIEGKSINQMFKQGDTISIRGRLATYGGQKQMTDIVWAKDTFIKETGDKVVAMPTPITLDGNSLSTSLLEENLGKLVTVNVTGRSRGRQSKDKSYTLYTTNNIQGLTGDYTTLSIRVNGTLAPGYEYEDYGSSWAGSSYQVTGILAIYEEADYTKTNNEPSYQITVGNRPIEELDGVSNVLSEIVKQ